MKLIDDLIEKMKATTYEYSNHGGGKGTSTLLSNWGTQIPAMRQLLLEFIQQNTNDLNVENETLKQRVFILEEIVKKSNFGPLIATPVSPEVIEVLKLCRDNLAAGPEPYRAQQLADTILRSHGVEV